MIALMEQGLSRRGFLAGAAGAAGALALEPGLAARRRREPLLRGGAFASGVVAGEPSRHAVTLWTRVHDVAQRGRLTLEVATDPGFARVVHRRLVRADPRRDFTVHARVGGPRVLKPGEEYFYRFHTRTTESRVGRFRTLRPPDSLEPVRIGVFSCQGWQAGYYTAHAALAQEELDLVVSLGDYIYELTDDTGPREDTIGPRGDGEAQTLPEYRAKYRLYRSDPHLQDVHAAHGFCAVWDSHEVESGWGLTHEGETQGRPRRVPYRERLEAGIRAYFENTPFPRFRREPNRIYRALRLGGTCDLLLPDLTSYSSPIECPAGVPGQRCAQDDDPSRSMLGTVQKRWLKDRLARSSAAWKVLGSSVMMMSLDAPNGQPVNHGQWDGYVPERRELMEHVLAQGIDGVTVVSGDIHTFFAGQVTTTGRSDGTPAATEFIGSSISSQGLEGNFGGEENSEEIALVAGPGVQTFNPHMAFADFERRGYKVLECRPDELLVDFRSPVTVQQPQSAVDDLARFRVSRSEPRVERTA